MAKRLMTIQEVADQLAVNPQTVRRLIHDKKLPYVQFSGKYGALRFRPEDVEVFIESRTQHVEQ